MKVASRIAVAGMFIILGCIQAQSIDLPVKETKFPANSRDWSFNFVPYAWITGLKGSQTIRGRTIDVDASFLDIMEKSDSIIALMMYSEARKERLSLFSDLVYFKLTASAGASRSVGVAPGIVAGLGASLGAEYQAATLTAGAAYEIVRWPSSGPAAFTVLDVMGGGRFWWQKANLALSVAGTVDLGDLEVSGARAVAKSGDVTWFDPFVGARLRHQFAPGHELMFSADVGGFGVGSDFSWQVVGAYSWDFSVRNNIVWSGVIGYRALYADYRRGSGRSLYEYDMLQHGPILGISMKF